MKDRWDRTINYMRISVTDRCNLRCCYCMPEEGIPCFDKSEILTFEEIERIIKVGSDLGMDTIKITGGEPLLRDNITALIKNIKQIQGIQKVTLTTNGVLLERYAEDLKASGVDSINVNLPALTKERYAVITRRDEFTQVITGMKKALGVGIRIKINCIAQKGMQDNVLYDYGMLAKQYPMDVRFIEMMPIGNGNDFESYPNEVVLERLEKIFGAATLLGKADGNGPAQYYKFEHFAGKMGFISPISHNFCEDCNRIRISAVGDLKLCLSYDVGVSLREVLRNENVDDLKKVMEQAILEKPHAHCFHETKKDKWEMKKMVQIGG